MVLLSFTVENHKSIRDEVTLDLTRPSLKTLQPKDGLWAAATYPLAGIFGGNASGKSTILDAILYVFEALARSATTWQGAKTMYRTPFALNADSSSLASRYEMDFVHENRRHRYGFEVDDSGIKSEWLLDIPNSRWRTLIRRDRSDRPTVFHSSVGTRVEVTDRELILSRSLLLPDSPLRDNARGLVNRFDVVLVKDSHREARLASIADSLAEGSITFEDLEKLLRIADIGVLSVRVEEHDIPEKFRLALRRFAQELQEETEQGSSDPPASASVEFVESELEQVARRLLFNHRGEVEDCPSFSIREESDGTIAWLATAVPALEVLRSGGLLLVDEIDSSLHPHLLEVLLGAFDDPAINQHGAQLIFTSHESFILSPLSDVQLDPEQVWFTDKSYVGVTELTCLDDFPRHREANVAKRYLTGRYGGVPRLSPSLFMDLVDVTRPESGNHG